MREPMWSWYCGPGCGGSKTRAGTATGLQSRRELPIWPHQHSHISHDGPNSVVGNADF